VARCIHAAQFDGTLMLGGKLAATVAMLHRRWGVVTQ